jgi:hypothetical protein
VPLVPANWNSRMGTLSFLTDLSEGQTATVLQLPAQAASPAEA